MSEKNNYPQEMNVDEMIEMTYAIAEKNRNEPTDTEILEFLLNQFQSHSLQMNGQHSYRFMNDGFPMNRAKGPNARDAVITAMREQQESMRKLEEKYPGWSQL
jgi:hypothetical protein